MGDSLSAMTVIVCIIDEVFPAESDAYLLYCMFLVNLNLNYLKKLHLRNYHNYQLQFSYI